MKKSYSELLKDPRWQKKRLEIMKRDKFQCQLCKDKETTLNVHHKIYLPEKDPWQVKKEHLVTICEHCHRLITLFNSRSEFKIDFFDVRVLKIKYDNIISYFITQESGFGYFELRLDYPDYLYCAGFRKSFSEILSFLNSIK